MAKKIDISKRAGGVVDLRKPTSKRRSVKATIKKRPANSRTSRNFSPPVKKKKNSGILTFLIVLLFLLVAAAIASFFIFGGQGSGNSLKLSLSAPKTAASGEEVVLEVAYENLDKTPLEYIELVIQYPEGFYYNDSNFAPNNQEKNIWELPPLEVGQSNKITVSGLLVGKLKEDKEFTAVLSFRPANFHSDFQETLSKKININDIYLDVEIEAPEQLSDGDLAEFKINYDNTQKEDLFEVNMAFEFDEGFDVTEVNSTTTGNGWVLDKIDGKDNGELVMKGNIDSTKSNPFNWYFKVWQPYQDGTETEERILFEETGQIEILSPTLEVAIEALDSSNFNWGEQVDYKISYKNTGKIDVKQAVLSLALNDLIDWSKYENITGATRDKNNLIWLSKSSGATADLAEIPAGSEAELMVTLPLIEEPLDLSEYSPEELLVSAQAALTIRFNDKEKKYESEPLINSISSEPRLITEARYYLDASTQVGSGPLPPKIGETTAYRSYWKLFSGSKGLKNVKIKSSLPAYINWQGVADATTYGGPLSFNEASRELIWEIDEVAGNTQLMASFDVAVSPSESQINQLLILTNPTSLTAEERETGRLISKTANLLTSELLGDPKAQGQGRVTLGQ